MYPISEVLKILEDQIDRPDLTVLEKPDEETLSAADILNDSFDEYFKNTDFDILSYSRIGVVINDIDRPTPSYLILEELLDRFSGLEELITRVHIATGSHRNIQRSEMEALLGDASEKLLSKVHVHDGNDIGSHTLIGTTTRGTEIHLDSELFQHDLLILINSVEPHYFAGFTGGRKSIVPGMAHHTTIEQNHSYAMDAGSSVLRLQGNPVHEDMEEGVSLFLQGREHLSFQMVQGPGQLLTGLKIGNLKESFHEAVDLSMCKFTIDVTGQYDLIVTIARSPMDRTLYQAQKALENGRIALKKGGSIILVAECDEGIGKKIFWDLLCSSEDPTVVLDQIRKEYRLGYHKAARLLDLVSRSRVLMVSKLGSETLIKGFIEGYQTLEEAIMQALEPMEKNPRVLLIPDGTVTVPNIVE